MISIHLHSATPVVNQITAEIKRAIARGDLRPGEPLPPVRQLAGDLGIHWNTVARAYRDLAADGYLTVVRGRGAMVSPRKQWPDRISEVRESILGKIRNLIAEGTLGGLEIEELKDLFYAELGKWQERG